MSHELIVLIINILIVSFAYIWLYPKVAGNNFKKILYYDLLSSIVAMFITATLYYGSNLLFDGLFFETNWFWFTFVVYMIVETPFSLWYFNKHDIWDSL